ncbi:MAG: ABC transporter ATP-binding protein [Tenericutes bacterium]|nr:ABC transporter ATP-binding protein [Mycoplasmatota bacterium]
MIKVNELTKSYGTNKGVFDLSFKVNKGEVFGFIGPNGAGKTTTIRHLLGFIHSDSGSCTIMDMDTHEFSAKLQQDIGYLPGEMAFFDQMTGLSFLKLLAEMRGLMNHDRMMELIHFWDLDVNGKIRKMSKGMKQKLGLVSALMHNPKILILDEPTSGLDPLMQTKFVDLIHQEKAKGTTILMSSHSFEEIERTCDRAGIIKNGKLVALEDIKILKKEQRKVFMVSLGSKSDIDKINSSNLEVVNQKDLDIEIATYGDINPLIMQLSKCKVISFDLKKQSLEKIFMKYYESGDKDE